MSKQEFKWRKVGGGTLRYIRGKVIKSNEIFVAREDEIPEGLLNLVEKIEPIRNTEQQNSSKKEEAKTGTRRQQK